MCPERVCFAPARGHNRSPTFDGRIHMGAGNIRVTPEQLQSIAGLPEMPGGP